MQTPFAAGTQVVVAQGFAALQFILEEKLLGSFRMQVRGLPTDLKRSSKAKIVPAHAAFPVSLVQRLIRAMCRRLVAWTEVPPAKHAR